MLVSAEAVANYLENSVKEFCEVAVIGISGGVDSAVVASVAVAALGADNVHLVSMPYDDLDRNTFNARSEELAEYLKAHHLVVPIDGATDSLVRELSVGFSDSLGQESEFHRLTHGNTRARMRMSVLYALSGELSFRYQEQGLKQPSVDPVRGKRIFKRVRVLGTGNASEDLIGYDTKGGDALADLFVIGDLFKSEVYQLAKHYLVPPSIIEAPPSAGLYEGQTDLNELGYSYEALEPALSALHRAISRGVVDAELSEDLPEFEGVQIEIARFVLARFLANAHKHRAPVVIPARSTELVKDIWVG